MLVHAMIIIQLHQKLCGIHLINPLWNILYVIIRAFAGYRIAEHHSSHGLAAKQPDIEFLHGAYPVWHAVIIDFKENLVTENVGRELEAKMPVKIAVKIFGFGIFNSFVQHHTFRILSGHINTHISRDSVLLVGQPLNRAGIYQRRHTYRNAVYVNLGIVISHLKLGHHLHQAAHFPVSQKRRRILIQKGDRAVIHFLDIIRKIPGFQR